MQMSGGSQAPVEELSIEAEKVGRAAFNSHGTWASD